MVKLFKVILALLFFVSGCGDAASPSSSDQESEQYDAGTYEVVVEGYAGDIEMSVEFSADEITDITVGEHSETMGIGTNAIDQLPEQIIENQSLGIDLVTGATVTSKALLLGIEEAVRSANGDVDRLYEEREVEAQEDIEKEADVIVVGGGGAGLSAAVSALQEGSSVILIEKTSALGGNTIRAGGPLNAVDPERQASLPPASEAAMASVLELTEQEPQNEKHELYMEQLKEDLDEYYDSDADYLFDSVALHILQTYDGGSFEGNIDFIELLCSQALDTVEWLESNGLVWQDDISTVPGGLWPRAHVPINAAGADFIETNATLAEELGVEILFNVTGENLIMEDERVVGITGTTSDGADVTLRANQAVILATGGFAANVEMRKEYDSSLDENIGTTNSPAITGDGIVMGEEVGTNLIGMEYIQSLPLGTPGTGTLNEWVGGIGVEYYYQINKSGERFMAEDGRRDVMTNALLEQEDSLSYVIAGEDRENTTGTTIWGDDIEQMISEGKVFRADTIEELAELIDVDAEAFVETHENFNAAVESGIDEDFGRELFGDPITAPFYASPRSPTVHHTMGGLEINLETQVLDVNGDVIQGLYAAGEVTGGIHGQNRLGGNALLDIHVFGRVAGVNAASENGND